MFLKVQLTKRELGAIVEEINQVCPKKAGQALARQVATLAQTFTHALADAGR